MLLKVIIELNLCSGGPLLSAVCDIESGFTITVDEECRASQYFYLDWRSAFLNGDPSVTDFATGAAQNGGVIELVDYGNNTFEQWTIDSPCPEVLIQSTHFDIEYDWDFLYINGEGKGTKSDRISAVPHRNRNFSNIGNFHSI